MHSSVFRFPFAVLAVIAVFSFAARAESETAVKAQKPDQVETVKKSPGWDAKEKERFHAAVTRQKDLPNFHQVHPFLYRSGEPTAVGMQKIKDTGISTIIDLRAPTEKAIAEEKLAKQLGMKYINLPMSSAPPTKKQVDVFLKEVKSAKDDPSKGPVLVHCAHGSDRTGCLVGIWRVSQEGWNYDKAYKEMRHYWFTPKFTKLSGSVREYAEAVAR